MPKIIITDDRHSHVLPVACNGTIYRLIPSEPTEVPDEVVTALTNSSISFETVGEGGGSAGVAEPPPAAPAKKAAKKKVKK